jgi:hypothetical protein
MNEWVLVPTCKQLVWSTRIGRNMTIWILCLILGSVPGAALPLEVTGCSRVIGTWSPRSSTYRPFARQASTSRLPEPTPLTVYRTVPQEMNTQHVPLRQITEEKVRGKGLEDEKGWNESVVLSERPRWKVEGEWRSTYPKVQNQGNCIEYLNLIWVSVWSVPSFIIRGKVRVKENTYRWVSV